MFYVNVFKWYQTLKIEPVLSGAQQKILKVYTKI